MTRPAVTPNRREGTWVRVTALARKAEVSRQAMLKKLLKLHRMSGNRLLHRPGPGCAYEVCVEVLMEFRGYDPDQREQELERVHWRIGELDERLTALRDSHGGRLRRVEKRLKQHGELLEALNQLGKASAHAATVAAKLGLRETSDNR